MAANRDVKEALTEYLESVGATGIDIIQGGKHPKLTFITPDGKPDWTILPMGNATSRRILENSLSGLRHKLGNPQPIESEARSKRRLEEMMSELQSRTALPNLETYQPQSTEGKAEAPMEFRGTIAAYGDKRLRIGIPMDAVKKFDRTQSWDRVYVDVCEGGWQFVPSRIGTKTKELYQQILIEFERVGIHKGRPPFGTTDAKFTYYPQDNRVVITEPITKSAVSTKRRRKTTGGAVNIETQWMTAKPEPIPEPVVVVQPAVGDSNWIVDWFAKEGGFTEDNIRAVLYAARYVDENSDYRLTRRKEDSRLVFDPKPSVKRID